MNGASRIEIEAMVVSVALVVMPLLVSAVYLVRRRWRPQVSFLEVIRAIDR